MGNSGLKRRDYFFPLTKALFARLDGTKPTDLSGNDVPVCDFFEKDTSFPRVEIGVVEQVANWDCKQEAGAKILVTIRIWANQTQHAGFKNVNKIAGEALETLTASDLDLTADGLRIGRFDIQDTNIVIREENGILSRIIQIIYFVTDTTTVQV